MKINTLLLLMNALHVLASVVWVGGMFFAHMALRPALMAEEPPQRLAIWARVLPRFFAWVWMSVIVLPTTGYALVYTRFDSFPAAGPSIEIMLGIGWLMVALFVYLFFKPYRAFQDAVATERWPVAGQNLAIIRRIVTTNLVLGLIVIIVAVSG